MAASKRLSSVPKRETVLQFRVSLLGVEPEIWRRIVVPERYSFWDLHVAIQDAMGWLDYHLHLFEMTRSGRPQVTVGIPDDTFGQDINAGWEIGLSDFFSRPGQVALYRYDFGDGWCHQVLLEGVLLGDIATRYPICAAGARACPPEDCGGEQGYERLLKALASPKHKRHEEMIEWLKGHAKNYHPFIPDAFDPKGVHFSNPKQRWKKAFESTD